jgi:hypothetical protein
VVRLGVAFLAAVITLFDEPAFAQGSYRWTAADVLYARSQASPRAQCIVDREIGGVGYDPYRRGDRGERGPVQITPGGYIDGIYRDWTDGAPPEDPYAAIPFLDWAIAPEQGLARHWSPVVLGLC